MNNDFKPGDRAIIIFSVESRTKQYVGCEVLIETFPQEMELIGTWSRICRKSVAVKCSGIKELDRLHPLGWFCDTWKLLKKSPDSESKLLFADEPIERERIV